MNLNASAMTRRLRAARLGVLRSYRLADGALRVYAYGIEEARAIAAHLLQAGYDAIATGDRVTVALPEPIEAEEIEEAPEAPAVEPAPLSGEFREDPQTGVVRYWTAEEVAAEPVPAGRTGWNPWAAGATVQEIHPDAVVVFRVEGDCEDAEADTRPEPEGPRGCVSCGATATAVLYSSPTAAEMITSVCDTHADAIEDAIARLAAAGLTDEEIRDELVEGAQEIRAEDAYGKCGCCPEPAGQ